MEHNHTEYTVYIEQGTNGFVFSLYVPSVYYVQGSNAYDIYSLFSQCIWLLSTLPLSVQVANMTALLLSVYICRE